MSPENSISTPAVPFDRNSKVEQFPQFLQNIDTVFGPGPLLGRMFLLGDAALSRRGLRLVFGTFEAMTELNARNFETWGPLVPLFDCRSAPIPSDQAFCLFALDGHDQVIACQAARLCDLTKTNLRDEAEAGRLFYPDATVPASERYLLQVDQASEITGRITYSGGLWVHPRGRKMQLSSVLPRISRALAQGKWNTQWVVSFARNALVGKGMIERYGYPHVGKPFQRISNGVVDFDGVLVWMSRAEMLNDTAQMVDTLSAEVNAAIGEGGSQKQPNSVTAFERHD
jgi:hypothetical protein